MTSLRINGDDYGMSESCTLAIAQALREGLITHTTMPANGAYFAQAVQLAKREGFAERIGIHFNLTEGAPLTAAIAAVPLFAADGRFHKGYLAQPRPLTEAEQRAVLTELDAQLTRLEQAGLRPQHADSHHYIHTFAAVAPLAAEVCRAHNVRRVRLNRTFDTPAHPRITAGRADNAWWREQGFLTTAHFGRLADARQGQLPDDTELMVHPDLDRNGVLIDRTGFDGGVPTGVPLAVLREIF